MRHPLATSVLAVAVAAAALAGCGGGGGDAPAPAQPEAAKPFMGSTVQSLLDYMNQLIAQTSETTEPEPVDNTPLPVDDTV
jgi:ABC-type glycerol-3-phosphate transport system substrate-binding protein